MLDIYKNCFFRLALILLFCSIFIPHGYCDDNNNKQIISLSLKEAVSLAYKNNTNILIQEDEVKIAKAQVLGAKSEFLPKIALSGGYTQRGAVISFGAIAGLAKDPGIFMGYQYENKLGIGIQQAIYKGGKNLAALKIANIKLKIKKESLRAQKLALEFEIKRLYYGLLLAYQTEKVAKELVDQVRLHYEEVKKKFQQGTSSKFELLQSKVQVSKVMPGLVRAENSRKLIAMELKKTLGLNLDKEIILKDKLNYTMVNINEKEFIKKAYIERPEITVKNLDVEANKQSVKVASSSLKPYIDAFFNYEYKSNSLSNMFNSMHSNWYGGISIGMSIFDGFLAKSKIEEAKLRYAQSKLSKEDINEQVVLDIKHACLDLNQAESIINSQKDSIVEAKEALRIAGVSYSNGVATNLEIFDAQVSLGQVQNNFYGAVYDYIMAKAYLNRSMGVNEWEEVDDEK